MRHTLPRSLLTLALCWLGLYGGVAAQTGDPASQPILRIETGMHTAIIKQIGVDAANRYLVTGSDDKTVRVWELGTGRLLRVIQVPIGLGDEGKVYAIALSPDGTTIAAGGWTSPDGVHESIYLFDRESGRLIRRLGGLPNVVNHLAYSRGGGFLAATLGGKNGVRIFTTSSYALVGEDRDYGDSSYGADFDREGRLATTSYDGFIRLYTIERGGTLRLIEKQSLAGGKRPYDVRFSPDGTRLGVGFYDLTTVAVLSAANLAPLYSPDTTGVNNGDLSRLSWSANGRTLYAAGRAQDAINNRFIRAWADAGRGRYRDIAGVGTNAIQHMLPLTNGGIVYGAGGPAIGMIDANDMPQFFISAAIAAYRDNQQGFLVAPDGRGVQFAYQRSGKDRSSFSVRDRKLDAAPAYTMNWSPPETEDDKLRVTDWNNTYTPKLNGTQLKLYEYERSRSLALAPSKNSFLLGTEWSLRLFDRDGAVRWRAPAPGVAWAVNISADGRLAVAAYGDGTIRWYRMTDGKELLAFFPHADRKRWILWTPSGYYDAAPGAEDLIGWHVNNGQDRAADFFPVRQFRDTFYRPDVVSKILETLDEQVALKKANEEAGREQIVSSVEDLLPPVVDIVSPAEGTKLTPGEVTVRYRLRSPTDDPVTSIMAMVDGKTVAVETRLSLNVGRDGQEREIKIKVAEGASLISLLAVNRNAPSVAAVVQVSATTGRGAKIVGQELGKARPKQKLYILAIGVGKYPAASGLPVLRFPAKDAADLVAAFQKQKGLAYYDVEPKVYPDATHDDVTDGLKWIGDHTTENDVAIIFIAGHGLTDSGNSYYFMPSDAEIDQPKRRGVLFAEISNTLLSLKGRKLLFVDTCRSGSVLGPRGIVDINGIANKLNSEGSGVAVFTASMSNESAEESSKWGNGAFTSALLEALAGKAGDNGKGEITYSMLDGFLTRRVRELTSNRQTPTATKPLTVPDFLVAVLR